MIGVSLFTDNLISTFGRSAHRWALRGCHDRLCSVEHLRPCSGLHAIKMRSAFLLLSRVFKRPLSLCAPVFSGSKGNVNKHRAYQTNHSPAQVPRPVQRRPLFQTVVIPIRAPHRLVVFARLGCFTAHISAREHLCNHEFMTESTQRTCITYPSLGGSD